MHILDPSAFGEITLAQREAVNALCAAEGRFQSAYAFPSLFLWQRGFALSLRLLPDAFFVRCGVRGETAYFFPCGAQAQKIAFLEELVQQPGASLHYVTEQDTAFLREHFPGRFTLKEARGDWEYLYRREEQLTMTGGKYKTLRGHIHRAEKNYRLQARPLTEKNIDKARSVTEGWQRLHVGMPSDSEAVELALCRYKELAMTGVLLENAEGPQAVAMGTMIAPDCFDCHIAKSLLPDVDAYLRRKLCENLPAQVEWLNQEEDMNLPGLRTTKTEARPARMTPLWTGTVL